MSVALGRRRTGETAQGQLDGSARRRLVHIRTSDAVLTGAGMKSAGQGGDPSQQDFANSDANADAERWLDEADGRGHAEELQQSGRSHGAPCKDSAGEFRNVNIRNRLDALTKSNKIPKPAHTGGWLPQSIDSDSIQPADQAVSNSLQKWRKTLRTVHVRRVHLTQPGFTRITDSERYIPLRRHRR